MSSGKSRSERTFGNKKPTKSKALNLDALSQRDFYPTVARLSLFPANPKRKAYMAVREIYLAQAAQWWNMLIDAIEKPITKEYVVRLQKAQTKLFDIQLWLRAPAGPLSLDAALKMIKEPSPEVWRTAVIARVGKRVQAGQPALKRYLALQALDIKCEYPSLSLKDITALICPCGAKRHPPQCKEQLRQQINRLVKFLRDHGHDFRWDRLTTRQWKVSK